MHDPLRAWRRRVGDVRAGTGRLTSRWRPLPQTLLIGGQRCGTTFLFYALADHPGVARPVSKEVGYFTHHWRRDDAWYRGHFPLQPRAGTALGRRPAVTLDATPYYLFHPRAAARAASVVPEAKLLVLLRDPVERAYSHYWHSVHRGWEELDFADALAAEEERLAGETARLLTDPDCVSVPHRVHSYLARGRYAEQLAEWLRHFPREQLFVARSEDFFGDPARWYGEIASFLGLPAWRPDFAAARRAASTLASPRHLPMPKAVRAQLQDYYRDDNAALAELLGWPRTWAAVTDERDTAADRP